VFLGVDIGSISVKFVLFVPPGGGPVPEEAMATFQSPEPIVLPGGGRVFLLSYDRLLGDPNRKVPERLRHWLRALCASRVTGVAVTGKAGKHLSEKLSAHYENDFRCLVKAALHCVPCRTTNGDPLTRSGYVSAGRHLRRVWARVSIYPFAGWKNCIASLLSRIILAVAGAALAVGMRGCRKRL